jgi:Zn finger protein HypA/HybF involved in hydrogenase expression
MAKYKRFCGQCDNIFETDIKFSSVCPDCKGKNHSEIKEKHLYRDNGKVLIV